MENKFDIDGYIDAVYPTLDLHEAEEMNEDIRLILEEARERADRIYNRIIEFFQENFADDLFWKNLFLIFVLMHRNRNRLKFRRDIYMQIKADIKKIDIKEKRVYLRKKINTLKDTVNELNDEHYHTYRQD